MKPIIIHVDAQPENTQPKFYVAEPWPEETVLRREFFEDFSPTYVSIDGSIANFVFENGTAVYEIIEKDWMGERRLKLLSSSYTPRVEAA